MANSATATTSENQTCQTRHTEAAVHEGHASRPCPGAACDVLRCAIEGCALTRAPLVIPPGSRV